MGAVKLELRCPQSALGIAVDPEPDWSFDAVLSELNSLELKPNATSLVPLPFTKTRSRDVSVAKIIERNPRAFVMRVSGDEMEDIESDGEEAYDRSLVGGRRFSCNELYLSDSDDSEDELAHDVQCNLMNKAGLVEGALLELTHEHHLGVKEVIRNQISALETDLMNESEKFTSALIQVEKYSESRREMDRKLDMQYQRKIAEALDNHLTAVLRDHEHRSQIEERRIRNDAALEEAKRKERALQEEKLHQEKAKVEAEARLEAAKKIAEEARTASLEAERRAAKEAAGRAATETSERTAAAKVAEKEATGRDASLGVLNVQSKGSGSNGLKKVQTAGNILKSAESALKLEEERLQKYKELDKINQALTLGSNKDFDGCEREIARRIKQISGTKENVRAKANELIKIFKDPLCPQSIFISMFPKKIVSLCESPNSAAFAIGQVIVLVTSQVPLAMDLLLAEFHRACIYTVPKHIHFSESAFESEEAYYKAIGYREENGKIESTQRYLERLESYMKLYGALVQTEIEGVQNTHGLKEGWAWLARLLNALPANIYTAVALEAFLKMAGFALFRKYKSQFRKILNIISRHFLEGLKARGDPDLNQIITRIRSYIVLDRFLREPEGRSLPTSMLSTTYVPEPDHRVPYYHPQNRVFYQ